VPWTFAHPAAILPLRSVGGFRLPLAALVIGSLAPDFGYYLSLFPLATFAHSALGILLFCLPAGALVLALFAAVRHDVIWLLPQPHRGALFSSMHECGHVTSPGNLFRAAIGLCVGAATHVVWDSFTHASGLAVHMLPALQTPVFMVGTRQMHMYNLLQHASTAVGLLAMLVVYRRWLRRSRPNLKADPAELKTDPAEERGRYVVLIGCLILACTSGVLLAAATADPANTTSSPGLFRIAILSTNAFAILVVLSAVVWRWRGKQAGQTP
jgi:Domain of unknown function (DUF4184)